ncbi:phage pre-tape measure protein, partial [Staphylococcus aureus]|uniref:phage pre-tape measure protein n=1 Tax=Staphylococcus aureus TaxID=1280 RepID=UPI001BFEDECE
MSLANLQLRTATVPYVGANDEAHDIVLHGLSANAIAGLILSQLNNIEEIFNIVEAAGVKKTEDLANVNIAEVGQR